MKAEQIPKTKPAIGSRWWTMLWGSRPRRAMPGQYEVAGEGSGEDAAVGDVEKCVEKAAGEAEEKRGGE